METYRLLPEGFRQIQQTIITKGIAIGLVLMLTGITYTRLVETEDDLSLPLIVLPGIATFLGVYLALIIEREGWLSYRLLVGNAIIIRQQARLPDVEIHRSQITSLQEKPGDGLYINTSDNERYIFVSTSLDRYEEVKRFLTRWRALEPFPQPHTFTQLTMLFGNTLAASVIPISLSLIIFSGSRQIVLPAAFLVSAFVIWHVIELQRNPNIPTDVKHSTTLALLGGWIITVVIVFYVMKK